MQDETSTSEPISLRERLKLEESVSEKENANPPRSSVYDFLYCDARRIASFLSQFETYGVAGQVKTSESQADTRTEKKSGGGGMGVPGVIQGSTAIEKSVLSEIRDVAEKTFDPFWKNARTLLDYLISSDMLVRDILTAKIGQIVLARGSIVIVDPTLLKDAWERPHFKATLRKSVTPENLTSSKSSKEKDSEFNFFIEVIKMLPHAPQCHLFSKEYGAWATLSEESLVATSADLMLKNGAYVPGDWQMVGVLDCFPKHALIRDADGNVPDWDKITQESMHTPISTFMSMLAPVAKQAMGRPETFYGVTPILIFREVLV